MEEPRLRPKVVRLSTRCAACGGIIYTNHWCLRGVVNGKEIFIHDNGEVCLQKLRAHLHLPQTDHQKFLSSRTIL
jgi:hypothetical protein